MLEGLFFELMPAA